MNRFKNLTILEPEYDPFYGLSDKEILDIRVQYLAFDMSKKLNMNLVETLKIAKVFLSGQ